MSIAAVLQYSYPAMYNQEISMKKISSFLLLFTCMIGLVAIIPGCKKDDPDSGNAKIMFVHMSPDAPPVDILIDNSKINTTALAYTGNTGYSSVAAGTLNIKINAAGTSTTALDVNINGVEKDKHYSVFAINWLSSITAVATEDNLTAPATGKAHIRFMHLSPGTPNVTVGYVSGSTFNPLYTNRAFETPTSVGTYAGFTPIDAGSYNLEVRVAGTSGVLLSAPGVVLQSGKIYTLIARGVVGSATTPVGASVIVHN